MAWHESVTSPSGNIVNTNRLSYMASKGYDLLHRSYLFLFMISYVIFNFFPTSNGRILIVLIMVLSIFGIRRVSLHKVIYAQILLLLLIASYFLVGFQFNFLLIFLPTVIFGYYLSINDRRHYSWWPEFCVFLVMSAYIIYKLITVIDINREILGTSRNQISVLMYVLLFFLILSKPPKQVNLVAVMLTAFICFLSFSRSAMLSSSILVFLTLSFIGGWKFLLPLIISLLALLVAFSYDFIEVLRPVIEQSVLKDPRMLVFDCYVDNISLERFLIGLNYDSGYKCAFLIGHGSNIDNLNAHNSYLSLFSYSSPLFFLLIPAILFGLYKCFLHDKFMFSLLLCFFIRCYFDNVVFFGEIDFVVWYVCFYIINKPMYQGS